MASRKRGLKTNTKPMLNNREVLGDKRQQTRQGSIWEEVIAKHRDELDKRLAELDNKRSKRGGKMDKITNAKPTR